jgi:DTW domain-containing protein YfiP
MGQLKPGAALVYERDGDTVYQREVGADPGTRTEVGYDYETHEERRDADIWANMKNKHALMMEDKLWDNIRRAARTNPALQDILDHAIMIYQLTKIK